MFHPIKNAHFCYLSYTSLTVENIPLQQIVLQKYARETLPEMFILFELIWVHGRKCAYNVAFRDSSWMRSICSAILKINKQRKIRNWTFVSINWINRQLLSEGRDVERRIYEQSFARNRLANVIAANKTTPQNPFDHKYRISICLICVPKFECEIVSISITRQWVHVFNDNQQTSANINILSNNHQWKVCWNIVL